MAGWILPWSAGAFWVGILFVSGRLGRGGAVAAALGGAAVLVLVVRAAAAAAERRERSRELLAGAGLAAAERASVRDRVLRAAGVQAGAPEASVGGWRPATASACGPTAPATVALLGLSFVFLGGGWGAVRMPPVDLLAPLDGRSVEFRGTAAADLRRFDTGWGAEIRVSRLEVEGGLLPGSIRIWLRGRARPPPLEAGQPVAGRGTMGVLRPDGGGFQEYLLHRGVVATVSVDGLEVLGAPGNPAIRLANAARRALDRGARRSLSPRAAGLLLGLSIGDLSMMDPEVEEDFRATGLGHLLAVSGSNVAMVLAPVLGLLVALRVGGAARVAAGLTAVGFFALVTRWEPSVLRASVMAALVLLAAFAGRPRSTVPVLGAAVLLLLVADPGLGHSVGFQLSVAATAGLAALAGPVAARLAWLPRPVAVAAGATLGAQVAVTPLLLARFGVVPTVTLLANVLAFPAVPAALFGGLAAAGVALVWQPAGRVAGALAGVPLDYLAGLADRLAKAPFPQVVGEGMGLPALTAVVAVTAAWRLRRGRQPIGTVATAVVAGSLLWAAGAGAGPPGELTVTFLDVGQGDAAVVRTPEGGTILIDSGPDEQEVARKLAGLGVRRIELAVVSHAHADHVSGFPAIFARFPVALLIEPGCPHDAPQYRRMLESAAAEGIVVRNPRGGERLDVGTLVIDVLGPDACSEEPNDSSLVLRLHPAGHASPGSSILFTGDVEEPGQRDLLADGDPVAAAVLKVPHQGGATSIEEFFAAVAPDVAVVSVGPNEYGHPVPWVLSALRRSGALVLRTDQAGDVTVRLGARGVLVESRR